MRVAHGKAAGGACCVVLLTAAAAAGEPELLSAAGQEHVWLAFPSDGSSRSVDLCHHAVGGDGPYLRAQMSLTQLPEAMAAWGERVWLVYPADPKDEQPRREVFTLRVRQEPSTGWYHPEPRDRLEVVEPLPAVGRLVGLAGTARGPVALLWPEQWVEAGVHAGEASTAAGPALESPRLLQLENRQWAELKLPAGLPAGGQAVLLAQGLEGLGLGLICIDKRGVDSAAAFFRDPADGAWATGAMEVNLSRVEAVTRTEGRAVLLLRDRDDRTRFEAAYVSRDRLLPVASFQAPEGQWALLGARDGLRLISQTGGGSLFIQSMDAITGQLGAQQLMRHPPLSTGGMVQMVVVFVAFAFTLGLVFLLRPASRVSTPLPAGVMPLPLSARAMGLVTDLAPAALLAVLATRSQPADVFRWPMWTADMTATGSFFLMAGLFIVYVTLSEMIRGTTPGKAMVGGRLISVDGSRPRVPQVLLRNLVKALTLLIPPLAVFMVLSPNLQGLGDLLSRTVVVREREEGSGSEANDR